MSKSEKDSLSRIDLIDSPDLILKKVRKAVTDCTGHLSYEPESRPGVANLVDIHCGVTDTSPDQVCEAYALQNTGQYKLALADLLIEKLRPIREKYERLKQEEGYVDDVLSAGNEKARTIAVENYNSVKKLVGFT